VVWIPTLQIPEAHRKAQLHCPGIGRNDDDWEVVSVNASPAEYAGKTRLMM